MYRISRDLGTTDASPSAHVVEQQSTDGRRQYQIVYITHIPSDYQLALRLTTTRLAQPLLLWNTTPTQLHTVSQSVLYDKTPHILISVFYLQAKNSTRIAKTKRTSDFASVGYIRGTVTDGKA